MTKTTDEEIMKRIKERLHEEQEFKTYSALRSTLELPKYTGKENVAQKNRLNRFMQIYYYPDSYKLKIEKIFDTPIPVDKGGRRKGYIPTCTREYIELSSKMLAHILLQINSVTCKLRKSYLLKEMGLFNFYSLTNNGQCKEKLGDQYSYFLSLGFRWNNNFVDKGLMYLSRNNLIRVEKTFSLKDRDLTDEEWNNLMFTIDDLQKQLHIFPRDYVKRCSHTEKNISNYSYLMGKVSDDMQQYYDISPFHCIKIFKGGDLKNSYSILSKEEVYILQKQLQEIYIQQIEKSIKRKILKDNIDIDCNYVLQLLDEVINK